MDGSGRNLPAVISLGLLMLTHTAKDQIKMCPFGFLDVLSLLLGSRHKPEKLGRRKNWHVFWVSGGKRQTRLKKKTSWDSGVHSLKASCRGLVDPDKGRWCIHTPYGVLYRNTACGEAHAAALCDKGGGFSGVKTIPPVYITPSYGDAATSSQGRSRRKGQFTQIGTHPMQKYILNSVRCNNSNLQSCRRPWWVS